MRQRVPFALGALALGAVLCAALVAETPAAKPAAPLSAGQVGKNVELDRQFAATVQPLLKEFCANCHLGGKKKGDLNLDRFTAVRGVQAERKVWRNLADQLAQRTMPPENKPQPSDAQYQVMLGWIEAALEDDCSGPRDPGRVAIHRLNRREYNNTVRDLVGVDFEPAADFPADDTGYGFDNIADVLTMSPLLAEKYLAAADAILDKAITDTRVPAARTVKIAGNAMSGDVGNAVGDGTQWNLQTNGEISTRQDFPATGEYEIRVRAYQEAFGDQAAKMAVRLDKAELKTFDVTALVGKPAVYSVRQQVSAGSHKIATAYLNNLVDTKNPDKGKRGDRNLIVAHVEIEGPFGAKAPLPSESHKRIFFVSPGATLKEEDAAWQVIGRFASRAFRRPSTAEEVGRLMKLYAAARAGGERFEAAVRVPLAAVLCSPHFLFRIELDPPGAAAGAVHLISEAELASRLSYFLWSSMPDDELFALATQGKLRSPGVLEAQVKRMLASERASEFVRNFAGQWLELRNLESHQVDRQRFPEFDDALRHAMRRETELFFQSIIEEDRSVLDLLDSDYTFVNERLAKHYGMKGVRGESFKRVSLAGTKRGGVMTMASVLTLTAMPTRTSPVKRGVFVLENILGTPPPPPPADVPALADKAKDEASASLRDRLAKHRADPNCAVCHMRMDGIGFALENFGPLGVWRDKEGAFAVDSTGELAGGRKIDGPQGLRELLASRKKDFVTCLTDKMLTYALGRGIEDGDRCTVKEITAAMEKDGYKMSTLIRGIIQSDAFQKRRGN